MTARVVVRGALAAFMVGIGVSHLVDPGPFVAIMPAALAAHGWLLVIVSGVFEILGGIGILVPRTRRFSGWGLAALYVAVFPANVNMALHDLPANGVVLPHWVLVARLPFQLAFIGLALWVTAPEAAAPAGGAAT